MEIKDYKTKLSVTRGDTHVAAIAIAAQPLANVVARGCTASSSGYHFRLILPAISPTYGNHQTLRESTAASEEPFFGLIEQAEVLFNDEVAWKVDHCPCIAQPTG